jgi:hypothetical protein
MNVRSIVTWLCIVIFPMFNADCTVRKRHYRNGFFAEWDYKSLLPNSERIVRSKATRDDITRFSEHYPHKKNSRNNPSNTPQPSSSEYDSTCADRIKLRNGAEIQAKLIKVTCTEISYTHCKDQKGFVSAFSTDSVLRITYRSGSSLAFESREGYSAVIMRQRDKEKQIRNNAALACFISAVTIIGFFISPIFGIIALRQIRDLPGKYKGEGLAVFGTLFGAFVYFVLFSFTSLILLIVLSGF